MKRMFVFLMFSFSSLSATIFVQIDPTVVKRVELSSRFQNRIAVSQGQGSIGQVVYPGCDIEINLDPTIGQVFVYPMTEYPQATSLTVVTDEGEVQDFELTFVDKPAEIVILETCEIYDFDTCCEEECVGPGHPDYLVTIVKGIVGGHVPEGFVACDIIQSCQKVKSQVRAHLVSKLVSSAETIYMWRLVSTSRRNQRITEKEVLRFQKGQWAYLSTNLLRKGEAVLAIVGVKN